MGSYLSLNQQHLLVGIQQRNGEAPRDQRNALGSGWCCRLPCFQNRDAMNDSFDTKTA